MKYVLKVVFILVYCTAHSQNIKLAKDSLVWKDGQVYTGTFIKEDKRSAQIKFMTDDSVIHYISSNNVARLTRVSPQEDTMLSEAFKSRGILSSQIASPAPPIQEGESINWSDPHIPGVVKAKHRTAIGLGISGGALFIGGTSMLIYGVVSNGKVTRTSTSLTVDVGPTGYFGIGLMIAGLPMGIVGITKAIKANKMARARRVLIH